MSSDFNIHKLTAFCIFLLCVTHLRAQEVNLQSVQIVPDIKWRFENERAFDSTYFGLPSVQFSEYTTHIRIALQGCLVDLHSTNGKAVGTVIYHINQCALNRKWWPHPKHEKTKKFYYTAIIDSTTSQELITHFLQKPIDTFPQQEELLLTDSIYQKFGSVQLQMKGHKEYTQGFFWPGSYVKMSDGTTGLLYLDYTPLVRKLHLEDGKNLIYGYIRSGRTYNYGGAYSVYLSTKRESRKWVKLQAQRDYMDSVKPMIDSFMSQVIQGATDSIKYQNELFLKFNQKGKLTKVKTYGTYTDYAFDRDFKIIKKQLQQLFKANKIDFISPERSYWKTLYFFSDRYVKIS